MTNDATVTSALKTLFLPGDIFEIRVLDAERPGARWPHVESGYFEYDHIQDVPQTLAEITTALGVYVTLNPVNPALLARAKNRIKRARQNETTRDGDILSRRWLLIDVDPARPAGISATDTEKEAAFDKALEIEAGLKSMQWPEPLIVDSGNGFYLMYRVDLPADDNGLIQRCIQALQPVATDAVHVDVSVHNPARICRLPGTWNRKGENVPDRPHRISEIIQVPDSIIIVSDQLLQALAGSSETPDRTRSSGHTPSGNTTAEAFNAAGDIGPILKKHGWQHIGDSSDNQQWRRPGKETGTHSATYNGTVFYVFSTDAAPFKNKGYSRFGVYSLLEHGDNHAAASAALSAMGYGPKEDAVDISGICNQRPEGDTSISVVSEEDDKLASVVSDPGPLPMELLRIPGFVSEIMDFCLENAPTRNHAMAFCGAVALQSVLGARKVRDCADNRTNLYLIALAPTGSGKDTPREINSKLLQQIGMEKTLASRFASGESIEDKLVETPVVLCQTDEFDGILLQMKNARDGRVEAMMDRYKEVFTSSNKTMYTRCLAGKASKPIHQPSLTIFGSAVPVHYYSALSEKMLTDGFFSRTIAVEAPIEIEDQEPTIIDDLPDRISGTAAWWSQFNPTPGNLANINPRPAVVPMTDDAKEIIAEVRKYARQIQNEANAKNDVVTAAVWSRVRQMTRKLALIYAISVNHRNPTIDVAAMIWARDFIFHQARRMVFMANDHVSENPFHAQCLKVIKRLRVASNCTAKRSEILDCLKCRATELNEIIDTLEQQGRVEKVEVKTRTKPALGYRLVC